MPGLIFHAAIAGFGIGINNVEYYLLVFATANLAFALNFGLTAVYSSRMFGGSLKQRVSEVLIPMLAPELFSALLTMAAVYVAVRTGTFSLALLGLVIRRLPVSDRRAAEVPQRSKDLQRIATTDELTGLANREQFREAIQDRAAAARETDGQFAVMLMDLDRFKEINDTLGHHYGDVLLRDLGPRLVTTIGEGGLVARLGGDEFGILPGPEAAPS